MQLDRKNAIIKNIRIGFESHNLLTAWLDLDYGGSGQGFGGYNLDKRLKENYAGIFIQRVLEIAGVGELDQLPGKAIRVETDGPFGKALRIGHITKDDWFDPSKEMDFGHDQ